MVHGQGPFEFVLDTGNGAPVEMFVSPSLQRRLGLVDTPGSSPFATVQLDALELGDWRHQNVQASVLDAMDQIGARIGVELAGNLGFHVLRHWQVRIDYAQNRVQLSQSDGAEFTEGVPFASGPGGAFVLLPVKVNHQGPFRFLVDTGASVTVIAPRLAREMGLAGQPIDAMGVQGALTAETFTLDSLEVAGRTVERLEAGAIDVFDYTSQAAGMPVDGILGYSFGSFW
jgi:predicted aspartyl protease